VAKTKHLESVRRVLMDDHKGEDWEKLSRQARALSRLSPLEAYTILLSGRKDIEEEDFHDGPTTTGGPR